MTVLFGDWGWGNPIPNHLKLDNFSGVGGYSSSDRSKQMSKAKAYSYLNAGLSVQLFAEDGAMCLGQASGERMGRVVVAHYSEIGAPPGMTSYLAEDYDSQPKDWSAIGQALDAFRHVIKDGGPWLGGFYGKLQLGEQMCRDGHVDQTAEGNFLFHQTEAWSGKAISSLASAYQQAKQVVVDGVAIDIDVLLTKNIGQWPQPSRQPPGRTPTMYSPPLRPIVCSTPIQGGGALAIADDGSSYYLNPPTGYPEHPGMNIDPKDWGLRVAAEVKIMESYPNKPITIKDTAQPAEFYDRGYLPGQTTARW